VQSRDGGGAASKQRYSARVSALEAILARRPGGALAGRPGGGGDAAGQAEAPPALRSKVLPGSEQFDANLYLGTIHAVS
jgi:hypothetical protein